MKAVALERAHLRRCYRQTFLIEYGIGMGVVRYSVKRIFH